MGGGTGGNFAGSGRNFFKGSVNAAVNEWRDIDFRKCNVVFFGVEESTSDDPEVAKSEDKEKVSNILAALDAEPSVVESVNIRAVLRMRKLATDSRPKLLKVVLGSSEEQRAVLKSASSLKNHASFNKVFIRQDLTWLERDQRRILWEKARKRQEKLGPDKRVFVRYNNRIITRSVENPQMSGNGEGGTSSTPPAGEGQ